MLIVFREQQKLDSSYLGYLIYHKATLIVNTAGGKCRGGGGGGGGGKGGEKILKLRFPILSKRKTTRTSSTHSSLPYTRK